MDSNKETKSRALWRQLIPILMIRLVEPISFTILFPFVYYMVKDILNGEHLSEAAYFSGIITSAYALAQLVSGIAWGTLSDRIGRKPVILIGLFGTGISLILFGLSKSILWAIISRAIAGLVNGNIAVIKTMVVDITDKGNRAFVFSLLPMIYGIGVIIGPLLGGYLAHPVDKYPYYFEPSNFIFLKQYPYFLPCFIAAIFSFINLVLAFYFLNETLHKPQLDETQTLLKDRLYEPKAIPFNTKIAISIYTLIGLIRVMSNELTPFWASEKKENGGLEFSTSEIGTLLSLSGLPLLFFQLILFVPLERKYGNIKLLKLAFLFNIPVYLLFPLTSSLNLNGMLLWCYLATLVVFRTFFNALLISCSNLVIVDSAPSSMIGQINGLSQSSVSLARTIGPTFLGFVYSWCLRNQSSFILLRFPLPWCIISLLLSFGTFIMCKIRWEINVFDFN